MGGNDPPIFSLSNPNVQLCEGMCFPIPQMNLPTECTSLTCYPDSIVRKTISSAVEKSDVMISRKSIDLPVNLSRYASNYFTNSATYVPAVLYTHSWVYITVLSA